MPFISDYGIIGNSRSCALVSNTGSIDWCCLPEFDSPPVFAALLDNRKGGCFSIRPGTEFSAVSGYIPDTNVLETTFKTKEGEVKLSDCFVALSEEEKKKALYPDHEILRVIEGVRGSVKMKVIYDPKKNFGKITPHLENRKKFGIHFSFKEHIFSLITTLDSDKMYKSFTPGKGISYVFIINEGERVSFSLNYSNQSPAILPELSETGIKRFDKTIEYWKSWISQCRYEGVYKEEVKRSLLSLKLLAHAPSGSIIAAPTTSLPEESGGLRNWDYRYCWMRDAAFTVRVLAQLGFEEEVHAYMNWILHATQLTRPKVQVVYSIFGNKSLKEKTLDWLSGYKDSKPVRAGNGADEQFQLDLYGEVLDAAFVYSRLVRKFDRNSVRFLIGLGEIICKEWQEPDNGIWEVRSHRVHHTHSKVMCWVGLDRLLKLSKRYHWKIPEEKFRIVMGDIRKKIEEEGFNEKLNSYTRTLKGDTLDASLLTLSLVNYIDADSTRMISTCESIYEDLVQNDLVYRYKTDDGLPGAEGTFGVCTFWLVENFAKMGKLDKAVSVFEKMLKVAGPFGLWSEEIHAETGELLGNYPQGFTHIGLINTALTINEAYKKREKPE